MVYQLSSGCTAELHSGLSPWLRYLFTRMYDLRPHISPICYQNGLHQAGQLTFLLWRHVVTNFITIYFGIVQQVPFTPTMNAISGFALWFLDVRRMNGIGYVCPDSVSTVSDNATLPSPRADWLSIVHTLQVRRISHLTLKYRLLTFNSRCQVENVVTADGQVFKFSCLESRSHCDQVTGAGLALSRCCYQDYLNTVKKLMAVCQVSLPSMLRLISKCLKRCDVTTHATVSDRITVYTVSWEAAHCSLPSREEG